VVVDLVDRILAVSERDPVVLVISDHGTGVGMDAEDATASDLEERFSNLLAIRTPGRPEVWRDGLTPVNLLNRVLAAYADGTTAETDDGTYAWESGLLDTYPVSPVVEWASPSP
jgi:hypothetical protein